MRIYGGSALSGKKNGRFKVFKETNMSHSVAHAKTSNDHSVVFGRIKISEKRREDFMVYRILGVLIQLLSAVYTSAVFSSAYLCLI